MDIWCKKKKKRHKSSIFQTSLKALLALFEFGWVLSFFIPSTTGDKLLHLAMVKFQN